ncbi:MAG: NAD-dependent epimerase/dehydratase family protein [Candidatus Omnitrophica bacterium]|nr:NAD-dependent epimerase/dehydratase family protein [Candidatus Omnitrophota bacterium]
MIKSPILIVGINGFLGSALNDYLRVFYPGYVVIGIDKSLKPSRLRFRIDLNDSQKVKKLLREQRPSYIFHLCGDTVSTDFDSLFKAHVSTTNSLLSVLIQLKPYSPRVIIPSSAAEYGSLSKSRAFVESDPARTASSYGISKALQSELAKIYSSAGLDIVIARMFNISGGGVPRSLSIGRFAYELALIKRKRKKPILETRTLRTKRDFLDIKDVCRSMMLLALKGKTGQTYNICSQEPVSMRTILNKMIAIAGLSKIKIIEEKNRNPLDVLCSWGSKKKLESLIGNFKHVSLEESLKDSYYYYLSKLN